jgi:hypothetical protein
MSLKTSWRILATSLVGVCLLTAASISITSAQPNTAGNRAARAPRVYTPTFGGTGKLGGVVDLAKLPKIIPGTQTASQPLPQVGPLTPAQRQAYEKSVRANPPVSNPTPNTRRGDGKGPSFVGGGVTPLLTKSVDGLNSVQAGGSFPDQAIAADLSYVMEGVNSAIAIYYASTGALAYGPYSAQSFFSPVYHAGGAFFNPQMYYDVMRDRWVVSWLEADASGTFAYLDIAISVSNSPTQSTPGGQYYIYQVKANFDPSGGTPSYCHRMTMGMDYWGIYFTCANFRNGFVGNTMVAFGKAAMLSGRGYSWWYYNDGLHTASANLAFALSPAIEEGVQDAEFFVSTDAGWGITSANLGLCAWTNLSNFPSVAPTISCMNVNLGLSYTDPMSIRQPGTATILAPDDGMKQVYYKAGRLYLAQTMTFGGDHDGIYWAEIRPRLTTRFAHNPQWVSGAVVTQVAYFDFGSGFDLYMPTLMGTDEDDISLVYNISGPSMYPSIELTGRKASDPDFTLGQGSASLAVVAGAHAQSLNVWGNNSACAVTLNSVTRGSIWCAGEYTGSVAAPGWNTRLYTFRME